MKVFLLDNCRSRSWSRKRIFFGSGSSKKLRPRAAPAQLRNTAFNCLFWEKLLRDFEINRRQRLHVTKPGVRIQRNFIAMEAC